jgi:hypothetical protein
MNVVRLSVLSTGRLYALSSSPPLPIPPQEILLILISVRGSFNSKKIVRPDGLSK